jgi:hypothetical protein
MLTPWRLYSVERKLETDQESSLPLLAAVSSGPAARGPEEGHREALFLSFFVNTPYKEWITRKAPWNQRHQVAEMMEDQVHSA